MTTLKTFYEDSNFILQYQLQDGVAYLHCRVFKFSSKVLRTIYNEFVRLQEEMKKNNIFLLRSITKNIKFCELFNGVAVGYVTHNDERYEVVEWELKPTSM